jgi:hypothetical protein
MEFQSTKMILCSCVQASQEGRLSRRYSPPITAGCDQIDAGLCGHHGLSVGLNQAAVGFFLLSIQPNAR